MKIRGAGRLATVLEENRDAAELGRKLATIVCEANDTDECFGKVSLSDICVHTQIWMSCEAFWLSTLGPRESSEIVKQVAQLIELSEQAV